MFGLEMFGLARFTLLSQDLIDLTVMAEPAFSALNTHTFWLARFKNLVFDGAKPQQRGSKNDSKILSIAAHRQVESPLMGGQGRRKETGAAVLHLKRWVECCRHSLQVRQQGPYCDSNQMHGRLCFWGVHEHRLGLS